MTAISQVAKRYAAALFEAVPDKAAHAKLLEELREVEKIFTANEEVHAFFESPLVTADEKAIAMKAAVAKGALSEEVKNLAIVMAEKERVSEWTSLVLAYQARADEEHGIVRGTVRAAAALSQDQRQALETRVAQLTGKKVILEYKVDPELLGGLTAQVGSLTFDDSLDTQLRLMNEDLKRRAH